jgi:hypothetical protein
MNEFTPIMAAPVTRDTVPTSNEHTVGAEQSLMLFGIPNPFADDDAE